VLSEQWNVHHHRDRVRLSTPARPVPGGEYELHPESVPLNSESEWPVCMVKIRSIRSTAWPWQCSGVAELLSHSDRSRRELLDSTMRGVLGWTRVCSASRPGGRLSQAGARPNHVAN